MVKKEVLEVRKQFTQEHCAITKICGCYINAEKEKVTQFKQTFLSLPEEEMFKYFELFRKTLSGSLGKNLINLDFQMEEEKEGGNQEFLYRLRDSKLEDQEMLDAFYDKMIENCVIPDHYLILLIHGVYDIPGKSTDGLEMDDASDEVYEYLLCSICPVKLSKPGLSYSADENCFRNRIRDWMVDAPGMGFLFPAFEDRSADIHKMLYYSKNAEMLQPDFILQFLGCEPPMTASDQKETFQALIENTLQEECTYDMVIAIQETLNTKLEEHKEDPEPFVLGKMEVKSILSESGVENEKLERFEQEFDQAAGEQAAFYAANVTDTRKFEIRTPDVVIKVNPERSDLVETKIIEGQPCLVVRIDENVEVNGISVTCRKAEEKTE